MLRPYLVNDRDVIVAHAKRQVEAWYIAMGIPQLNVYKYEIRHLPAEYFSKKVSQFGGGPLGGITIADAIDMGKEQFGKKAFFVCTFNPRLCPLFADVYPMKYC